MLCRRCGRVKRSINSETEKKDHSMAVSEGIVHLQMGKLWRFELAHFKEAECIPCLCPASLDPQINR